MPKNRVQTVLVLVVAGAGLILAALGGLWAFMSATPPLHSTADDVTSSAVSAPAPGWADAAEQARLLVRTGVAGQNLPGASVAVGAAGEIVWAEGFGFADLTTRAAVTPETRFRTGTLSMALTSAGVGLLAEQGLLNLDEDIRTYVPEFPQKKWRVTLRHLMGHTAGLGDGGGDESPLYAEACERPIDALPAFGDRALRFQPGTAYRYSSYGWILVSAAVEAAAGERFAPFMRRRVFEPLGMDDTKPDSATEPIAHRAAPYFPRFAADPRYGPDPMRPVDYSCYAGAGVFLSTPSDLARFAMALARGALLLPTTVHALQTSQRLQSGDETGYGLGWDLETAEIEGRPSRVIGHDGESLGGTVASLVTVPEHDLVVAVMSNTSYADTFALAVKVAEAFAVRKTRRAR